MITPLQEKGLILYMRFLHVDKNQPDTYEEYLNGYAHLLVFFETKVRLSIYRHVPTILVIIKLKNGFILVNKRVEKLGLSRGTL